MLTYFEYFNHFTPKLRGTPPARWVLIAQFLITLFVTASCDFVITPTDNEAYVWLPLDLHLTNTSHIPPTSYVRFTLTSAKHDLPNVGFHFGDQAVSCRRVHTEDGNHTYERFEVRCAFHMRDASGEGDALLVFRGTLISCSNSETLTLNDHNGVACDRYCPIAGPKQDQFSLEGTKSQLVPGDDAVPAGTAETVEAQTDETATVNRSQPKSDAEAGSAKYSITFEDDKNLQGAQQNKSVLIENFDEPTPGTILSTVPEFEPKLGQTTGENDQPASKLADETTTDQQTTTFNEFSQQQEENLTVDIAKNSKKDYENFEATTSHFDELPEFQPDSSSLVPSAEVIVEKREKAVNSTQNFDNVDIFPTNTSEVEEPVDQVDNSEIFDNSQESPDLVHDKPENTTSREKISPNIDDTDQSSNITVETGESDSLLPIDIATHDNSTQTIVPTSPATIETTLLENEPRPTQHLATTDSRPLFTIDSIDNSSIHDISPDLSPFPICDSSPCANGGRCSLKVNILDGIKSYVCNCTGTGFTGSRCDKIDKSIDDIASGNIDEMSDDNISSVSTIKAGRASVGPTELSLTNLTASEDTVTSVSENIDENKNATSDLPNLHKFPTVTCDQNPCQNNGTCIDNVDDETAIGAKTAYCECQSGWMAPYCSHHDPCASSPCLDDAECSAVQTGVDEYKYSCNCSDDTSGAHCEKFIIATSDVVSSPDPTTIAPNKVTTVPPSTTTTTTTTTKTTSTSTTTSTTPEIMTITTPEETTTETITTTTTATTTTATTTPVTTTSSATTQSTTTESPPRPTNHTAGIVGGIIGAILAIVLIILCIWAYRYIKRSRKLKGKYNPAREEQANGAIGPGDVNMQMTPMDREERLI